MREHTLCNTSVLCSACLTVPTQHTFQRIGVEAHETHRNACKWRRGSLRAESCSLGLSIIQVRQIGGRQRATNRRSKCSSGLKRVVNHCRCFCSVLFFNLIVVWGASVVDAVAVTDVEVV